MVTMSDYPVHNLVKRRRCVKQRYSEDEAVAGFSCSLSNCGLSFGDPDSLEVHLREHLQQELNKINKLQTKRKNTSASASSSDDSSNSLQKLRGETFLRICERRQRRKLINPPPDSSDLNGLKTVCQVCLQDVDGSLDDHKDHMKACIRAPKETEVNFENYTDYNEEEEFEEYSWSGQTRIRASSLVHRGESGGDFTRIQRTDETEELDVTGDTNNFGPDQFTEQDLARISRENVTRSSDCKEAEDTPEKFDSARESHDITSDSAKFENKFFDCQPSCSYTSRETDCSDKICNVIDATSTSQNMDVLKDEYENLKRSVACRVCLDVMSSHVVSTVCWHVHCQVCWLQVLATKKMCPQCKAIVTAVDLRRIYI